jgi:hypothetical protein
LQQTGSLAKSQAILNTAIEVSAGTGESLTSVSEDLAKAYYGNTRSLKKYSLGLTDAELKAKSFSEIQDILNKKFTGSNATYLKTYAGQLNILSLAWNNLQENAGKALFTLAGANGDQSSGAKRLGGIIDAFGTGLIAAAELINNAFTAFGQAYFGVGSAKQEVAPSAKPGQELFRKSMSNDAKLKAIEAEQAKLYKQQLAATKALTLEQKKQAALKKAGTVFDLEQIQIIAALKGKLSEEDRIRLQAQLAILNENEILAASLTKQILMAQDSSGGLYKFFLAIGDMKIKNPFAFLDEWIIEFQKKLNALTFPKFDPNAPSSGGTKKNPNDPAYNPFGFPIGAKGGIGSTSISPSVSSDLAIQDTFNAVMIDALAGGSFALEAGREFTQAAILALSSARYEAAAQAYGMGAGSQTIEIKVTGDGDLTNAIASSLQQSSLSTGNQTYINRRTGGFE